MLYTMADAQGPLGLPRERKPLAGYLRLTVDRTGRKIGYEVQKRAIEAGATALGETIGEWYQDKDLTAADLSVHRPEYERMLSDVQAGHWGGIAVWRLDRLVRLTREFERVNAILEDGKGYLLSIEPMLSTRDQMGKFVIRLIVMLAEMEIDSMKARAVGHHKEKARNGKYSGGGLRPFGFVGAVKDDKGNVLNSGQVGIEHNATEAALIREAVRRLLGGESYSDIVNDWRSRTPPVVGTAGKPFRTNSLQAVLRAPRVAGLREYKDRDPLTGEESTALATAEWKPIVDAADWRRIVALMTTRAVGRPHEYLLSGIAVCGECGKTMNGAAQMAGKEKVPWYRCQYPTNYPGACGSNMMRALPTDQLVLEAVTARVARTPEILDAVDREIEDHDQPVVQTSMDIIEACDRKLEEYAAMAALPASKGGLSRAEWMAFREGVMRERADAVRRLESHKSTRAIPVPMGRDRQELRRWLDGLTLAQRRAFIRGHVLEVRIAKGYRGAQKAADLGRVSITFADAKKFDTGGDEASVSDLRTDALLPAPAV